MTAPLLKASNLSVTVNGARPLDCANIDIAAGEVLGILGPNGSGKSTCLKVLAGVLSPASGTIQLCGRDWAAWQPLERARRIAYLPQQADIYWDFRVDDLLALGASRGQRFAGWPFTTASTGATAVARLVQEFELEALQRRRFDTLSGGEQARVLFASAAAARPAILLADEPTASLDVCHQLALMRRLRELASDMALVLVLHDLNLAARFVDRVVLFRDGRTVLEGPTAAVLASPEVDRTFQVRFQRLPVGERTLLMAE